MYYIIYGLLYLISLLPFWVIYLISDVAYGIIYYIVRYRRGVVDNNLALAFPEKTVAERQKIAKQFYKNFTDNFIETIKLLSISKKELNKRFRANYDVINNLYASGKTVQIHLGHQFNWEIGNAAYALNVKYPFLVVYMPISNKYFDRLFIHLRKRFNTILLPATEFRAKFKPYANMQHCLVLVADQSPAGPENAFWATFFGQLTAFVKGPEKGALLNNTAIVMCRFKKIKRGYYSSHNIVFTTEPRTLTPGEITSGMAKFIEDGIREDPANYLWTHKRWKFAFDEKYRHNVVPQQTKQ